MTPRRTVSNFAHLGLSLALVFMILEAEHIGGLWGEAQMSHRFAITLYCSLLIAAMPSRSLTAKTAWGWLLVLPVLFLYAGSAVPEGIEDLREIPRALLRSSQGRGLLLLRLAFTLFLAVPLLLFGWLAVVDVRGVFGGRAGGKQEDVGEQR